MWEYIKYLIESTIISDVGKAHLLGLLLLLGIKRMKEMMRSAGMTLAI